MRRELQLKIVGVSPLLSHNGDLANPFNPVVRELKKYTGKRKKTDEDLMKIAELEWRGSLYLTGGKPCIPGECLEGTIRNAAKKSKEGKTATLAIDCPDPAILEYEGPQDLDKLWADENFRFFVRVKVKQNTVYRMRPIFKKWAAKIKVCFDDDIVNEEDVRRFVEVGGQQIGILDWRPRFGRFELEKAA